MEWATWKTCSKGGRGTRRERKNYTIFYCNSTKSVARRCCAVAIVAATSVAAAASSYSFSSPPSVVATSEASQLIASASVGISEWADHKLFNHLA